MHSDSKLTIIRKLSVYVIAAVLSHIPIVASAWEAALGLIRDSIFIESYVSNVTVNGSSVVNDKIASITVPTKVGALENDSGFVTESITNGIETSANVYTDGKIGSLATVASTGNYNDLTNKPSPPLDGKTYDFGNGTKFTKTVYDALTNVIITLGGCVTNVPTFKN